MSLESELREVARGGNVAALRSLLDRGAKVDAGDGVGVDVL